MQRGHAVEEVGRHSGACVYGFLSRRGVSAGVAEAHCYVVACEMLDRGQSAGLLRRQGDDSWRTGCEPLLDLLLCGRSDVLRIVHSAMCWIDEWALDVEPECLGAGLDRLGLVRAEGFFDGR